MIHKWVFDETAKDFYGGIAIIAIMHIAPIIVGIMVLAAMAIFFPWYVTALFVAVFPFVVFCYLMWRMGK